MLKKNENEVKFENVKKTYLPSRKPSNWTFSGTRLTIVLAAVQEAINNIFKSQRAEIKTSISILWRYNTK